MHRISENLARTMRQLKIEAFHLREAYQPDNYAIPPEPEISARVKTVAVTVLWEFVEHIYSAHSIGGSGCRPDRILLYYHHISGPDGALGYVCMFGQ